MKQFHCLVIFLVCAGVVTGAELRYAGSALDAPKWRSSMVPKVAGESGQSLDVDGDNVLGTAGYVFFAPSAPDAKRGAAPRNLASLPSAQLPTWVSAIESLNDTAELVRLPGYAQVDDPNNPGGATLSGALVPKTPGPGQQVPALRIMFGEAVPPLVRLGVMTDNLDRPAYNAAQIELIAGEASVGPVPTSVDGNKGNNQPDWYFFDIVGAQSGESIDIRLAGRHNMAAIGILCFDETSNVDAASNAVAVPQTAEPKVQPKKSSQPVNLSGTYYGQFEHPERYLKDYYVFKAGETYHLFYNIGMADGKQNWQQPGNEEMFGHATSADLKKWDIHEGVLATRPLTWEEATVSAPSIIERDGRYWMAYTGFDRNATQQIGIAVSDDLFDWQRLAENPVYQAPEWAEWEAGKWADCRDGDIVEWQGDVLMFTTVRVAPRVGFLAIARSKNLIDWEDLGKDLSIEVGFHPGESPRAFVHDDKMYVFATSGQGRKLWVAEDPTSGNWRELPFEFPGGGLWSGWEVVEGPEGQTIFSAFLWKNQGNFIRFWEVDWQGELPVLVN